MHVSFIPVLSQRCRKPFGLGDLGKSRNAGETSCFTSTLTSGWLCAHTRLGMHSTQNHTRGIDFRITQASKFEFWTTKTTSPPTNALAVPPSPEEEIWRGIEGARRTCLSSRRFIFACQQKNGRRVTKRLISVAGTRSESCCAG